MPSSWSITARLQVISYLAELETQGDIDDDDEGGESGDPPASDQEAKGKKRSKPDAPVKYGSAQGLLQPLSQAQWPDMHTNQSQVLGQKSQQNLTTGSLG